MNEESYCRSNQANKHFSGTVPVSVFPPFEGDQPYPAQCVIYSEQPDLDWCKDDESACQNGKIQRTFGYSCLIIASDECCVIGVDCDVDGKPFSNSTALSLVRESSQIKVGSYQPDVCFIERLTAYSKC